MHIVPGYCKDCSFFEYKNTKMTPTDHPVIWGYCRAKIPINTELVNQEIDLDEYFVVDENHYCSYFKRKKE
jgi:hypothetical protein